MMLNYKYLLRSKPTTPPTKRTLRVERDNLEKNIAKTESRMEELDEEFWKAGGTCCTSCWSGEYRELSAKNNRRRERLFIVKNKLTRLKFGRPVNQIT